MPSKKETIVRYGIGERNTISLVGETVTKTVFTRHQWQYRYMSVFIPDVEKRPRWYAVKAFNFQSLASPYDEYPYGYSYQMARLIALNQREKDMVYVFLQADSFLEGAGKTRLFTQEREDVIQQELSRNTKLVKLLTAIEPYYNDLHDEQVMRTIRGAYKMVDLDSFADRGDKLPPMRPKVEL